DLKRLANPPRRVGRQAGAVADVEAINRLHQAAYGFLQQVGITEGVMAKAFGDVGGEADIGGSEAMLAVNVAIVDETNCLHFSGLAVAIISNKLSHGPGLEGRSMSTEAWEMANENTDQLALALPEASQQLTFFFGSQQVRGKNRGRRSFRQGGGGCS